MAKTTTKKTTDKTTNTKTSTTKTTNTKNTATTTTPKGTNASNITTVTTKYTPSASVQAKGEKADKLTNTATDFLTNTDLGLDSVKNTLSTPFEYSDEYKNYMKFASGQIAKQSEGTKWDSTYDTWMNDYLNREKFEYDVDNDQLFQQALASAMNSGKTAMQDTIGQASSLTGGYASTFATSAGNQAYNQFIEDAYNNLPEYYQTALEAYQMESQDMFNKINALSTAITMDWNRGMDMYKLYTDQADRTGDRDYTLWNAGQSQAVNLGNLIINENQTIGSNLYNAANLATNSYNSSWEQGFNVDSAYKNTLLEIETMNNNDAWEQATYDQTEKWNTKDYEQTEKWNQDSSNLNWSEYKVTTGDTNGDGKLSASEKAANNTSYSYDSKGNVVRNSNANGDGSDYSIGSTALSGCKKIVENGGTWDDVIDHLEAIGGNIPSNDEEDALLRKWVGLDDGSNNSGGEKVKTKTGTVSTAGGHASFEINEGDNFDVTYEGESYRVENKGKVSDGKLINELDTIDASKKSVFVYQGDAYVKADDGYYKVGKVAWNIGTKSYGELLKAMTKSDK